MTLNDPAWPFLMRVKKTVQNKPQIAYICSKKLTFTIWGLERNYYVTESRDVKTKATIVIFGFILPKIKWNWPQIAYSYSEKLTLAI